MTRSLARHAARLTALFVLTWLAACGGGGGGGGSSAPPAAQVTASPPSTPVITASPAAPLAGKPVSFTASSSDPQGLALTYAWDFGDGSTASGASVTHAFAAGGSYTVKATVTNSSGLSASATLTQGVISVAKDQFVADCVNCAATGPNNYSGSGLGVWRYTNSSTTTDATININIGGVSAGKKVTLLFANGTAGDVTTLPSAGTLMQIGAATKPMLQGAQDSTKAGDAQGRAQAHEAIMRQNEEAMNVLLRTPRVKTPVAGKSFKPGLVFAIAPPALGTSRSWTDLSASTPTAYSTSVVATCTVSTGRNVVVWGDTTAGLSQANITALTNAFCGQNGGYSRLAALLGDAWGGNAGQYPNDLIQDSANALQDINIVIAAIANQPNLVGYFSMVNNFLKTSTALSLASQSNEALVFFINASWAKANSQVTASALLHEATHMINFYQRLVSRGTAHDRWLEETSAMMAEDIVVPAVLNYSDIAGANGRVANYVATGGAVNYIVWPTGTGANVLNNYALGGAFGAFLNRRYGLSIFKQLVTNCNDGGGSGQVTSYVCLDTLIQANGGTGFADDFARFGATIFAKLPPAGLDARYGYPARSDGGYNLQAIDVSALGTAVPNPATALGSKYSATTHTYQIDTVAAGKTSYVRNGVVVPANTTLLVVIQ
jgi:PKD repeat protein